MRSTPVIFQVAILTFIFTSSVAFAQDHRAETATGHLSSARAAMGLGDIGDSAAPFAPERFIISRDPPGMTAARPPIKNAEKDDVERSQSVNGQTYTVIAPIFLGGGPDGGNTSFIRFYNRELHTSSFTVNIVAYKTDTLTDSQSTVLGTATVTVPKGASPQYSIAEIIAAAGIPIIACPTTCAPNVYQGAALYIRNVDDDVGFQHVMFNTNSLFFENMTLCADESMSDGSTQPYMGSAINVHSSLIAAYPASLVIHNFGGTNGIYEIYISDARTGNTVGLYTTTLLANTTYVMPESFIEAQAGWAPNASQGHININVYRTSGGIVQLTNAVIGQLIYNQALRAYINMSQVCKILH